MEPDPPIIACFTGAAGWLHPYWLQSASTCRRAAGDGGLSRHTVAVRGQKVPLRARVCIRVLVCVVLADHGILEALHPLERGRPRAGHPG